MCIRDSNQAINVDAPHPAAARLFQEYLYSDAGQNAWIKGGASPILYESMKAAGTIDPASAANLPKVDATPKTPTSDQSKAANDFLKKNWDAAVA